MPTAPTTRTGGPACSRSSAFRQRTATRRPTARCWGPGGRRIDGDYRITEYHPPRVIGFEVTAGPLRPAGRFTLAETGPDATTVSFSLDAQPAGLMRLMSGMVTRQMRTEVAQLGRLKQILER